MQFETIPDVTWQWDHWGVHISEPRWTFAAGDWTANLRKHWAIGIDILKRTGSELAQDRIPAVAASVTFFLLLAIFPGIASVVSLYGLFADRHSIQTVVMASARFLPAGATSTLHAELQHLISQPAQKLNFAFVSGLVVALWSASGGIKALVEGLNVAYEAKETRSFIRLTLQALIATAAAVLLSTVWLTLIIVVPVLVRGLPFYGAIETLYLILRWPIVFLICVAALDVIYQLGPNRGRQRWRWMDWGSAVASALWIIGTLLYSWYAAHFGSYDRVYGNLGAAIGFMVWIWLSIIIMFAGAELDCEIARRRRGIGR